MLLETKLIRLASNKRKLKLYISKLPSLTRTEKYRLWRELVLIDPKTVTNDQIRRLSVLCNKLKSRVHVREQKREIKTSRANGIIFYQCSKHNKCAPDHKAFQGKLYVDRYWRSILKEEPPTVLDYIRSNNIKTIQWVMGNPVWMTTRPYCKHRLVGVDTPTVLSGNVLVYIGKDERRLPTPKKVPIIRKELEQA